MADPAILESLHLDPQTTTLTPHGGSGFSSTFRVTSLDIQDGEKEQDKKKVFFIKTGRGKDCGIMFAGEHQSLNAIHAIDPTLCPKSYAHGPLAEQKGGYFLATDFLDLSASRSSTRGSGSGVSLARKLAKLHSSPAPIPEGHEEPVFGFPVPTCCGNTVQDNTYSPSWADFYANNRLLMILKAAEKNQGVDAHLSNLVHESASRVVPALLREGHLKSPTSSNSKIRPVVVHGDLWSGNHGRGTFSNRDGEGGVEEVIFDASACWAHSEYEFGIMKMFGGFGGSFEKEYFEVKGEKDEPVGEWEDRVRLYELYHHLNHYAMFGGSYRSGAIKMMQNLIEKYGGEEDSAILGEEGEGSMIV